MTNSDAPRSEPAPCPFCQGSEVHPIEIDRQVWATVCRGCGAIGPHAESEQGALQRWRRPDGAGRAC